MNQTEALRAVIKLLNRAQLPYMITGAYAVSYYGEPRATHDLDIVMEISKGDVEKVCGIFNGAGYEFDRDMVDNAAAYHSHFTVIHSVSNLRIDFWMAKDREPDRLRFSRRRKIELFGLSTFTISPEDLILVKLEWFAGSKNSKHFDDAVGIIRVQGDSLDSRYIVEHLGTEKVRRCWKKAFAEAE